ncbi:MAG TPA: hypothetical protein VJ729_01985 [Nitrososphaeraceae archaeon]|jgi:hypothetical protein|nr:hypothetical protein [Nitrososphaeraceae archaeon]
MLTKKIDLHAYRSSSPPSSYDIILQLVETCRKEPDKNKRIELLNQINSMLLKPDQLTMPSHLTIEYINIALHKIEGLLLLLKGSR